jgi:transcriptional regulator with XRE-family HTH domain
VANIDPIGNQILKTRKERGLSVPDLSSLLNIPADRIYKWEQGSSSPKYADRQVIEQWLKDKDWKKVPDHSQAKGSQGHVNGFGSILEQTIYNLTESNRLIAESNASLARSNEELVKKVTVNGERETLQDVQTKLLAIQEFVLERSVKKEPYRSKEEAAAALGIITTGVYKSMKKTGTHDGAGK